MVAYDPLMKNRVFLLYGCRTLFWLVFHGKCIQHTDTRITHNVTRLRTQVQVIIQQMTFLGHTKCRNDTYTIQAQTYATHTNIHNVHNKHIHNIHNTQHTQHIHNIYPTYPTYPTYATYMTHTQHIHTTHTTYKRYTTYTTQLVVKLVLHDTHCQSICPFLSVLSFCLFTHSPVLS